MTKPEKPKDVTAAEVTLWLWTAWTCIYGIYDTMQTVGQIGDLLSGVGDGGMNFMQMAIGGYASLMASFGVTVSATNALPLVVSIYLIIAAVVGVVNVMLGQGRQGARSSVLWGVILQLPITLLSIPFADSAAHEAISDIPDIGLQLCAVYLLYTKPSRTWFKEMAAWREAK